MSSIFSRYLSVEFLKWFGGVFGIVFVLLGVIELMEMLRRISAKPDLGISFALHMVLLKIPFMLQQLLPFIVLFASLLCLWRLNRHYELVAARSLGLSVWQILSPLIMISFLIGIVDLGLLNPLKSKLMLEFESLENRFIKQNTQQLGLTSNGIWLNQNQGQLQDIIHIKDINENTLNRITVYQYQNKKFLRRLDAPQALLSGNKIIIKDSSVTQADQAQRFIAPTIIIPTEFTSKQIEEVYASSATLNFWTIPRFIKLLESAGLSTTRYKLSWHSSIAKIFFLMSIVTLAASFALQVPRSDRIGLWLGVGALCGFFLFFLNDLSYALGISNSLPMILAAWMTTLVCSLISLSLLLHLEDG